MTTVKEAAEQLEVALRTVEGVRVYRDPSATVDPPGVLIAPPRLRWEDYCAGPPTSATFVVIVMVAMDARAVEELWEWVPLVAAAIDTVPDAAVAAANPGVFNSGGTDLPSYEITVEVSL